MALYAGWLTAAACVSLGTVLAGYGVLFGDVVWAALGIALAFGIALRVHSLRRTAPEYLGAVIWALIGIVVANLSTPDSARWAIAALAGAGAAVLALRAAAPQR